MLYLVSEARPNYYEAYSQHNTLVHFVFIGIFDIPRTATSRLVTRSRSKSTEDESGSQELIDMM